MENYLVLHAEDDDASAFLFRLALDAARLKATVHRVLDGEHALLFLRKQPPYEKARTPHLVILDLHLPKINGWEVLSERQQDAALQPIPFIVLSTAPYKSTALQALRSGAHHYIEKPASLEELTLQVQTYCGPLLPSSGIGH